MSLFTPAVVIILATAALCALLAFRLRVRSIKYTLLVVATAFLVLAVWLGASDAWAFRDGFPLPAPGAIWSETHGLAAAKAFLLGFWVSLLGAIAVVLLIVASWRHPAAAVSSQHNQR